MDNVSRPLIALLVGSVAFLALWLVALKPSGSSTSGKQGGLGQYQSAINKAHQAAATANAATAAEGGTAMSATTAATAATSTKAATAAATAKPAQTARHLGVSASMKVRATANPVTVMNHALQARKVVALLFYNPAATDDKAVKQELAAVPTHGGKVVKLAVPVTRLAQYSLVTNQVPIEVSPTLVLIDKARRASTIVGFSDRFEIAQRVADALS